MSKHCTECGQGTLHESIIPEHVEDVGGVRVRLMQAVTQRRCTHCGETETIIPDMKGLVDAVAMARALEPVRLGPADLKLMRRALDMKQREFAEQMGVAPETVSRWEAGAAISSDIEKAVRYGVCALLSERQPLFDYDPTEITRMRIPAVRAIVQAVDEIMCFYRVRVRAQQRKLSGQVWEPQECIAA